jgi:hypothetical protein
LAENSIILKEQVGKSGRRSEKERRRPHSQQFIKRRSGLICKLIEGERLKLVAGAATGRRGALGGSKKLLRKIRSNLVCAASSAAKKRPAARQMENEKFILLSLGACARRLRARKTFISQFVSEFGVAH